MKPNILNTFVRANFFLFSCRYHNPKDRIGEIVTLKKSGKEYEIFKQTVLDPHRNRQGEPGAIFEIEFRFKMDAKRSMHLNVFAIPFFFGIPGFRNKLWLWNKKTDDLAGIYEFDTVEDAKNYGVSFAQEFIRKRIVPGSYSYEVYSK